MDIISSVAETKLLAAAAILGLDTAIDIIQAQREPLLLKLARARSESALKVVVEDFEKSAKRINEDFAATRRAAKGEPQAPTEAVKRVYTKRSAFSGKETKVPSVQQFNAKGLKTVMKAGGRFTLPSPRKLHKQAEKAESKVVVGMAKYLTHGPQPIRMILQHLSQKCLIEDTGVANVRAVTAILKTNATFARASSGNTYKLRTGKTKA